MRRGCCSRPLTIQPGADFRAQAALQDQGSRSRGCISRSHRQSRHAARGRDLPSSPRRSWRSAPRRRRSAWRQRDRCRSHRSAIAPPDRFRDHRGERAKTHRLLVVYEGVKTMGIGAEISAMIVRAMCFTHCRADRAARRRRRADCLHPVLEKAAVPQEQDIFCAASASSARRKSDERNRSDPPQGRHGQDSGVIVEWKVAEGERVETGQVVFEMETGKSMMESSAATGSSAALRITGEPTAWGRSSPDFTGRRRVAHGKIGRSQRSRRQAAFFGGRYNVVSRGLLSSLYLRRCSSPQTRSPPRR